MPDTGLFETGVILCLAIAQNQMSEEGQIKGNSIKCEQVSQDHHEIVVCLSHASIAKKGVLLYVNKKVQVSFNLLVE